MTGYFFFDSKKPVRKFPVLLVSTTLWMALAIICIFFTAPLLAADPQTTTPLATTPLTTTPTGTVNTPDVTASLLKVTAGLLLVIVAIFASAWFYRRFGNLSPVANDALRIIGGLSIGQKEKIVLLQVGDEQLLVGVAPGSIQKLHVLEKPIPVSSNADMKNADFASQLGRAIGLQKNKNAQDKNPHNNMEK